MHSVESSGVQDAIETAGDPIIAVHAVVADRRSGAPAAPPADTFCGIAGALILPTGPLQFVVSRTPARVIGQVANSIDNHFFTGALLVSPDGR